MEWMNREATKKMFEVNTFGPVFVTNAFLPLLRISRGRVVIVTSVTGLHIQKSYCIVPVLSLTTFTLKTL
jgi:NAD(P)-dependent dehydrogenase (short-subunit alcohol dehydrogenase family)